MNAPHRYHPPSGSLDPTELGRIASHFYLSVQTIEAFSEQWHERASEADILHTLCSASEFANMKVPPPGLTIPPFPTVFLYSIPRLGVGDCDYAGSRMQYSNGAVARSRLRSRYSTHALLGVGICECEGLGGEGEGSGGASGGLPTHYQILACFKHHPAIGIPLCSTPLLRSLLYNCTPFLSSEALLHILQDTLVPVANPAHALLRVGVCKYEGTGIRVSTPARQEAIKYSIPVIRLPNFILNLLLANMKVCSNDLPQD
jgi:hypothetical protein